MDNKLRQIADQMKAQLAGRENGWVQRALFGGLILILQRQGREWRLALGRTKTPPSATETAVCEEAFRLPPGVEWSWKVVRKDKATYQVAEAHWIDVSTNP